MNTSTSLDRACASLSGNVLKTRSEHTERKEPRSEARDIPGEAGKD
jgi:hypothetical protein